MKIFAYFFILFSIILVVSICIWESKGNPKSFFKKIFTYILLALGSLVICAIFIILFAIIYKIVRDLIVASILAVAISFMLFKIFDR